MYWEKTFNVRLKTQLFQSRAVVVVKLAYDQVVVGSNPTTTSSLLNENLPFYFVWVNTLRKRREGRK